MLEISEVFVSLQGETTFSGWPSTFIRLAGCNLNCRWCDTEYAKAPGRPWSVAQILEKVETGPELVSITGGEPLMQGETPELVNRLLDSGRRVVVETNGSLPIDTINDKACRMVDLKTPSSGQTGHICWANLDLLTCGDEIKMVAGAPEDLPWIKDVLAKNPMLQEFPVNISPVFGVFSAADLAAWILQSQIKARLNLQLHRIIWPDCHRGR